ncbi:hypothetical protein DPMN_173630 [Dreissena polymorpha]|uniref:Uncharacterized protein n=1 Tax=Dreissena polymorpha TaxID=45954 RepID=A0A9D4E5V5_DREPO|nr:hypothetical protein DPMN_173630 [Dreissena polymorpha]
MSGSSPYRENCHYIHIEKNAPPTGRHVFSQISTIFELIVTSRLHEDWASNVTSTVFFFFWPSIIGTNVLTKFHEDRTINVASRVFTRQMLTTDARRMTDKGDHNSSP